MTTRTIAFVHGVPLGTGGLGVQAANALRGLARTGSRVHAIGPGPAADPGLAALPNVTWHQSPRPLTSRGVWRPFRRYAGLGQARADRTVGRFAAATLDRIRPDLCYAFTQVGLETLQWTARAGVPSIVESPNGHIAAFREIYISEMSRWCGGRFLGHPTLAMVERVVEELSLATRVRVSSQWAARSLEHGGVPRDRITCLQQPVDLGRYLPQPLATGGGGPLRVCAVGSLDLRKGFVYLLRAARQLGETGTPISLRFVGATGDRCSRLLLERERSGLDVVVEPGDPRPALGDSEIFVLPTLEDGSPFAVAEAMASARPVVTTTSTGAAEWVRPGETGWLVEARSEASLAAALTEAFNSRARLGAMGAAARADTEQRAGSECDRRLAEWVAAW